MRAVLGRETEGLASQLGLELGLGLVLELELDGRSRLPHLYCHN